MFRSERMKKVSVLALERDIDGLMLGLGTVRAIHLTPPARESEGRLLGPSDRTVELERLTRLTSRVERLSAVLGVSLDLKQPGVPEAFAAASEVDESLGRIEPEIDEMMRRRQVLTDEAAGLRRIIAQAAGFEGTAFSPAHIEEFSFVHFALGSIPQERLKKLESEIEDRVLLVPFRDRHDRQKVLAITSKKGRWALDSTLRKAGFEPEDVKESCPGLPDEVLVRSRSRLAAVADEDEGIGSRLTTLAAAEAAGLRRFWRHLRVRQKIVQAHANLGRTQSTYLISGWVPVHVVEDFVNKVLDLTEHRAVIEIHDPDELGGEEPPTSLKHPRLVRPFALLVSGYGYPRYGEIEPTLIVAISFFGMFGAMFGDVGQGGVLLAGGLALFRWMSKPAEKDFGLLVAMCGLSAVIFGFVYGSLFGREDVIPALWGAPMDDVLTLLKISVGVGVVIISLGVILNILNKLRTGQWAAALFDRFGLAGVAFYWGALGLGVKYALSGRVSLTLAGAVILVPLALIFLKEPVRFALSRSARKAGGRKDDDARSKEPAERREGGVTGFFVAVIEGAVEVLEAVLLYTANTASFMRLGAYALSHAGLCIVIFALGDALMASSGGLIWSVLLIVLGNAVVILLEGLVVAVQTLRLEYYEFFGKFFSGEGQVYKPFDLRSEES
jgi:V/A-type H+-transporting ATPase subunit I